MLIDDVGSIATISVTTIDELGESQIQSTSLLVVISIVTMDICIYVCIVVDGFEG